MDYIDNPDDSLASGLFVPSLLPLLSICLIGLALIGMWLGSPGLASRHADADQPLFGIQTIDPLGVHFPALPFQKNRQAPIPVAHPAAGQFAQSYPQRILRIAVMLVA
jgi:hypothetical protein